MVILNHHSANAYAPPPKIPIEMEIAAQIENRFAPPVKIPELLLRSGRRRAQLRLRRLSQRRKSCRVLHRHVR